MNQNLKSYLAVIGANTIYGLNYVIAKGIMPDFLLPRAIVLLRVTGTLILFWTLQWFLPSEKVRNEDLSRLALCALLGVVVNQSLFFEGLNRSTPISASIISIVTPILILVFSHFILKDKITGWRVFGIMLGGAGALTIVLAAGMGDDRSDTLLGDLMLFTNFASWSLYLVLMKPLMERYDPITIMKWTFFFGFIVLFPFSIKTLASSSFGNIPSGIWMALFFVVFITTGFAYFLINYSLKRLSPNINGICIYLQPLVAALVAVLLGKDLLTGMDLIAASLIMLGVYLVTRRPKSMANS